MGLLIFAGVMFTGCQQNVDIETDKVELSDGTWEIEYEEKESWKDRSFSYEAIDVDCTRETFGSATCKIENEKITFINLFSNSTEWIIYPDDVSLFVFDDELEYAKKEIRKGKVEGSFDEKTIIIKYNSVQSEKDIAELNTYYNSYYEFLSLDEGQFVIKTNKKKTEYEIIGTVERTSIKWTLKKK